jgi:ABC-2 type transport system ATP-binding protein
MHRHNAPPAGDRHAPAVRLSDVHLCYGAVEALAGVSISVAPGSLVALVGRNGAGKSTMIKCLAGLLVPDRGRIELFGGEYEHGTSEAAMARRSVGFLLSEPALFQYLTVAETLAFLADAYALPADEAVRRTEELLRLFDLAELHDRMADELSTGTAKRLALAAALAHAPRLLVLDEPFESLDPLLVRRIRRLLVRYVHRGGSVLLSSHLVDVVQEIADHVYILEKGRVVFEGAGSQFREGAVESRRSAVSDGGALESLYASLVDEADDVDVAWL